MASLLTWVIVWVNVADMQTTLFVQGSMFLVVCSIVCSATSLIEAFPRSLRLSDWFARMGHLQLQGFLCFASKQCIRDVPKKHGQMWLQEGTVASLSDRQVDMVSPWSSTFGRVRFLMGFSSKDSVNMLESGKRWVLPSVVLFPRLSGNAILKHCCRNTGRFGQQQPLTRTTTNGSSCNNTTNNRDNSNNSVDNCITATWLLILN